MSIEPHVNMMALQAAIEAGIGRELASLENGHGEMLTALLASELDADGFECVLGEDGMFEAIREVSDALKYLCSWRPLSAPLFTFAPPPGAVSSCGI